MHPLDRLRRADAGDDVLALRVQEELAVELPLAGRRVPREADARSGRVAAVPEHHLHDVHGGPEILGNVVRPAVDVRTRRVPGVEHRAVGAAQLVFWLLRERPVGLVLVDGLERRDELAQVVGGEIDVVRDTARGLEIGQCLLEAMPVDAVDHLAVHLEEPPVRVERECTRFLIPAVSTKRQGIPAISTSSSTGSTVVPATLSTTTRWSPATLFSRLDLPTFGFPSSATRRGPRCGASPLPPRAAPRRSRRACPPTRDRGSRTPGTAPQAQRPQQCGISLTAVVVDLVRHQHDGSPTAPQHLHDLVVGVGSADGGVDDEHDDVRLDHGPLGLGRDQRRHPAGALVPTAGVDEQELPATPVRLVADAVPGHSRHVLDHRLAPADDPVDQRRLPDVGPTDHRHHRQHDVGLVVRLGEVLQLEAEAPQRLGRERLDVAVGVEIVELALELPVVRADQHRLVALGLVGSRRPSGIPGTAAALLVTHVSS